MPHPHHHPDSIRKIRRDVRRVRVVIGERLQARRRERQMTLERLARLSGLPAPVLDRYELGRDDITLLDLARLARAMQMSIDELLLPN